ncbi:type II secretion system protein [Pontibacterium granulatum]|uniref:PilW family protein n=1 Tax=Pontibacterium granulatum TaxID=2036029 RepID=UPI00249C7FD1|nr:type II secretion system protein [Pontibacterium granulatum]MDI3325073.1 type II secretion system protein [Pontibacterium granulatum]
MKKVSGFTLVELVIVIVLLSIMSLASVRFIANFAEGYVDTSRRQNMADVTQLAIERIGRELRNALPNSVRISNDANASCIEYIPVLGASSYDDLPVATASNTFSAIPLGAGTISGDPLYVAVYPITGTNLYSVGASTMIAQLGNPAQFAADQALATEITVALNGNHQFPTESPASRFFIVGSPVSYCLNTGTGDLYRYENYFDGGSDFYTDQPMLADLPSSEPNRALLATDITTVAAFPNPAFASLEISLQRNALVVFDLQVSDAGESVRIQHVVQVRNAP